MAAFMYVHIVSIVHCTRTFESILLYVSMDVYVPLCVGAQMTQAVRM